MTFGYLRVSTVGQTIESQRLSILDYANRKKIKVNEWIEAKVSSRKSPKARKLDELFNQLQEGDLLIVAELSRLARSVGQIALIIDDLIKKKVRLVCVKEGIRINGKQDIQTKVLITTISLFAEIERDLISERTKEGLIRARSEGKLLGRPKGTIGKSKLDGKEKEIKGYLEKGVNITNISRIYDVSRPTMVNFVKTREIEGKYKVKKNEDLLRK